MTRRRADVFDGADLDALWAKVRARTEVSPSGCWLWQGAVNSKGYGCVWTGTGNGLVHRLAVLVRDGSITPGLQIDHTCHDTRCHERPCPHRLCVNPDHLAQVTPRTNVRRQHEDARCQHGHPLTTRPDGPRRCLTCARAYAAARRAGMSSASSLALGPGPDDVPLFDWPPPHDDAPHAVSPRR